MFSSQGIRSEIWESGLWDAGQPRQCPGSSATAQGLCRGQRAWAGVCPGQSTFLVFLLQFSDSASCFGQASATWSEASQPLSPRQGEANCVVVGRVSSQLRH